MLREPKGIAGKSGFAVEPIAKATRNPSFRPSDGSLAARGCTRGYHTHCAVPTGGSGLRAPRWGAVPLLSAVAGAGAGAEQSGGSPAGGGGSPGGYPCLLSFDP